MIFWSFTCYPYDFEKWILQVALEECNSLETKCLSDIFNKLIHTLSSFLDRSYHQSGVDAEKPKKKDSVHM